MNAVRSIVILILAVLTTAPAVAFAQQTPLAGMPEGRQSDDMLGNGAPTGRDAKRAEKKREEVMKKIEAVKIWRLTEELRLDQPTAAKLSAFLSSFDQERKIILREQAAGMRELRRAVNAAKPDESKLKETLNKLEKNYSAMQGLREKEFNGLKDILTVEQQARFVLFQQRFHHEIKRMLEGARTGGPGVPETGPGGKPKGPAASR